MARSGAEGGVELALPVVDPATPVFVDMCVTEWGHSISNDSQPSHTTCNWNAEKKKLFKRKDVVATGLTFTLTGYYEGDAPRDTILEATYLGKIRLRRFDGKWLVADEGVVDKIDFAGSTDSLQTFKLEGTVNGEWDVVETLPV